MFNIKNIIIGASVGFVLSFIIGLFSSVAFGFVILRAFIFAIVGAALGFGCSFLFDKFLKDAVSVDVSVSNAQKSGSSAERKTIGGLVDITVEEGSLDEDVNGPKFVVGNNEKITQKEPETESRPSDEEIRKVESSIPALASVEEVVDMAVSKADGTNIEEKPPSESVAPIVQNGSEKSAEPVSDKIKNQESGGAGEGFQPMNMAQSAPKIDKIERAGKGSVPKSDGGQLDMLPDIGDVYLGSKKKENSDIINDSEFASDGQTERETIMFPNGESAADKNTNEMAMAIRTILAKDK